MTSRRALFAVLTLVVSICKGNCEFTVSPMVPENVTVNEDVVFHCSHSTADAIGWLINGSSLGSNPPDDITPAVNTLTIIALPKYNNTEIRCVAVYFDGVTPIERSDPVTLVIPDACGSREVSTAVRSFIEVPRSQNVPEGVEVRFRCRHRATNTLLWEVDGVLFNESSTLNATTFAVSVDGSTSRHFLLFDAILSYHHTSIVCAAVFLNGCPQQKTMPALLLIQGPLRAISGVFRERLANQEGISYFWEPPPTLDLTGVEPDIVYCVEVYNITCGADDLIASECELTNPVYPNVDEGLDPNFVYNITVVPRSNIPGAANGAVFSKQEKFMSVEVFPKAIVENLDRVEIKFGVFINDTEAERLVKARARSYSIEIESMDDPQDSVSELFSDNEETITVILPERQTWTYSSFAYGCQLHPVSVTKEMSTHAVQNISLTSDEPGELTVTGDFITNTSALGTLAIVYSTVNDSDIHYIEVRLPQTEISLTGLSGSAYSVSAFVIEKTGLPFNTTATLPKEITIHGGIVSTQTEVPVEYELHSINSSCISVNCTFLDSSTTDCVAVVHQRISQLSSSGLMNIESSHKFNRSGDSAYGCIDGVNLTVYQIGVVGGRQLTPTVNGVQDPSPSVCTSCIIIGVVASVIILIMIVILVVLLVCLKWSHRTRVEYKIDSEKDKDGDSAGSRSIPMQPMGHSTTNDSTPCIQTTTQDSPACTSQTSKSKTDQTPDETAPLIPKDIHHPTPLHGAENNAIPTEGPPALAPSERDGRPTQSREWTVLMHAATTVTENVTNGDTSTGELQSVAPSKPGQPQSSSPEASSQQSSSSTDEKDTNDVNKTEGKQQLDNTMSRPSGDGQEDTHHPIEASSGISSQPSSSELIVTPPGISNTYHSKKSEVLQLTSHRSQVLGGGSHKSSKHEVVDTPAANNPLQNKTSHRSQVFEGGSPSGYKLIVDKSSKHEVVDTPDPQNKIRSSDDSQSKSPFEKTIPVRSSAMPMSITSRKHSGGHLSSSQDLLPSSDVCGGFSSNQEREDELPLELEGQNVPSSKERKMT